jgi:hypothetical protein
MGRLFVAFSGFIIESVGWARFFVFTMIVAIPGLLLAMFGPIERAAAAKAPEKPAGA